VKGRQPQVEVDRIGLDSPFRKFVGERSIARVDERDPLVPPTLPSDLDNFRIPLKPDQLPLRTQRFQHGGRVPAKAEGSVDHRIVLLKIKSIQQLLDHHRSMSFVELSHRHKPP
jgi:hypothetical protein